MTDIRALLHDAAPAPARPLDMRAVRARARRPSLRRIATWFAGIVVVAGATVPFGGPTFVHAGDGDGVAVVEPRPGDRDAPDGDVTASTTLPARSASSVDASGVPSRGGPSPTTTTAPAASVDPPDYPRAPACSVDDRGLAAGEQRTCRFTATSDGGASFTSSGPIDPASPPARGDITVTRDGVSTVHHVQLHAARAGDLTVFAGCDAFIEPGDLVDVVLTMSASSSPASTLTLGAGESWAC